MKPLEKYHLIKNRQRIDLERRRTDEYHEFTDDWDRQTDWGPLGEEDAIIDQFAVMKLCEGLRDSPDIWCLETIKEIEDRALYHIEAWERAAKKEAQKRFEQERSMYLLNEKQINQDTF